MPQTPVNIGIPEGQRKEIAHGLVNCAGQDLRKLLDPLPVGDDNQFASLVRLGVVVSESHAISTEDRAGIGSGGLGVGHTETAGRGGHRSDDAGEKE